MVNKETKFWDLVVECLSTLLNFDRTSARKLAKDYRTEVESEFAKQKAVNVIYHESPVQVACDIAGKAVTAEHMRGFKKILESYPTTPFQRAEQRKTVVKESVRSYKVAGAGKKRSSTVKSTTSRSKKGR